MNAPVNGLIGQAWRTLTFPVRAAAPIALLARRALRGNCWVERTQEREGTGPNLKFSAGDDVQRPRDGAGPLNHRTYTVKILDSLLSPEGLIDAFRHDPNRFSPTSYATFVPTPGPSGLVAGETYEVKLPGPWDGPVNVKTVEPRVLRLETMDGHMEAGWIEFTAGVEGSVTDFKIESFARSGDAAFDYLYHQIGIGKSFQTEMWAQVLESAVEISSGSQQGRIEVETVIYNGADK